MPRRKIEGICSVENCGKPLKTKGFCRNHYMMHYLYGRTTKLHSGDKRKHPFYHLWFERKQSDALCLKWANSFEDFVKDVSPKPEGNYFIVRLRNEPYGPDNFKWQENLKRKKDEPRQEWWARKWAARQLQNPGMESDRSLRRSYGINRKQYNELLKLQNNVCAICGNGETTVDSRTSSTRKLAVDHCHKSNKIRALLCWRCNSTLGQIKDNLELLKKIEAYLTKHKEAC